jgi:hypothetical protein
MKLPTISPEILAQGRHGVTFIAGMLAMAGIHSINGVEIPDLASSWDHMVKGATEFMVGAGPIIAFVMSLYSKWSATQKARVASVAAISGVTVVAPPAIAKEANMPQDVKSTAEVKIVPIAAPKT